MKFDSTQESKAIDLCRLPLAFAVIVIHLCMKRNGTMINWSNPDSLDIYEFVECFVTNELAAIAVPLFFVVSGYLFFYKVEKFNWSVYSSKIKRRFHSLIIPYLVFNTLALAGLLFKFYLSYHDWTKAWHGVMGNSGWYLYYWCPNIHHATNIVGYEMYTSTPVDGPLWFLRDLIVVALLSPVVYYLVRFLKGWLLLPWMVLYVLLIWIPYVGFSPVAWFYFSVGAFFSANGRSMANHFYRWRWPLLVASAIMLPFDIYFDGRDFDAYFNRCFLLVAVPTAFNFFLWIVKKWNPTCPKWAGQASFFLFATHTILFPYMMRPTEFFRENIWTNSTNGWICVGEFFLMWIGVAAFCLALFFLMRKFCSPVLNFLTGKRNR